MRRLFLLSRIGDVATKRYATYRAHLRGLQVIYESQQSESPTANQNGHSFSRCIATAAAQADLIVVDKAVDPNLFMSATVFALTVGAVSDRFHHRFVGDS